MRLFLTADMLLLRLHVNNVSMNPQEQWNKIRFDWPIWLVFFLSCLTCFAICIIGFLTDISNHKLFSTAVSDKLLIRILQLSFNTILIWIEKPDLTAKQQLLNFHYPFWLWVSSFSIQLGFFIILHLAVNYWICLV